MKYIITESKLDSAIIKWLNSEYGDLEPYGKEKYAHIFFMKEDEIIFSFDKRNGYVNITNKIWRLLKQFFGLTNEEVHEITKEWVEEYYNLDVNRMETESVYYPKGFNPKNVYEKLK